MKRRALFLIAVLFYFVGSPGAHAADEPALAISLSLDEATVMALENNIDIQLAKYDAYIKDNDLLAAESVFDTIISGKIAYRDNQSRQASTIFGTKAATNEYELSGKKKLPTGTTLTTGLSLERDWTNSAFATTNPSHDIKADIGIAQELGKNFFGLIDRGNIKITKLDIQNSSYTSLDKIEFFLAEAQRAYWKLILEWENLNIERQMLEKAEDLLLLHVEKEKIGLMEAPQILASGANLKQRENEVLLAENSLKVASNDLLYKLNLDPDKVTIAPLSSLLVDTRVADYIESLKTAIAYRRDYLSAKNEAESKNIKFSLKKNSLWPEISLELTFSRNGLDKEYKEAFGNILNEDNPEYYAGLTFSFALENKDARSEFNKAKLDKARQILKIKGIERKIVIDIKDKIDTLAVYIHAARNAKDIVKLQDDKLKAEERRFRSARSDTDTIIRYQEDLLKASLAFARAQYNVKIARIDLALAENSLLDKYWKGELR